MLRCETLHTVQTGHSIKDGYRCQKVLYGTLQGKSATYVTLEWYSSATINHSQCGAVTTEYCYDLTRKPQLQLETDAAAFKPTTVLLKPLDVQFYR